MTFGTDLPLLGDEGGVVYLLSSGEEATEGVPLSSDVSKEESGDAPLLALIEDGDGVLLSYIEEREGEGVLHSSDE